VFPPHLLVLIKKGGQIFVFDSFSIKPINISASYVNLKDLTPFALIYISAFATLLLTTDTFGL